MRSSTRRQLPLGLVPSRLHAPTRAHTRPVAHSLLVFPSLVLACARPLSFVPVPLPWPPRLPSLVLAARRRRCRRSAVHAANGHPNPAPNSAPRPKSHIMRSTTTTLSSSLPFCRCWCWCRCRDAYMGPPSRCPPVSCTSNLCSAVSSVCGTVPVKA